MDKQSIIQLVIQTIKQEKESIQKSAASAKQAALEAPGAMQSHSDTTKFQMTALAGNFEQLIAQKESAIKTLQAYAKESAPASETILIGSLVQTSNSQQEKTLFFILPEGNGVRFKHQETIITVITPRSPLALALLNKKKNDHAIFESPTTHVKKEFLITEIW